MLYSNSCFDTGQVCMLPNTYLSANYSLKHVFQIVFKQKGTKIVKSLKIKSWTFNGFSEINPQKSLPSYFTIMTEIKKMNSYNFINWTLYLLKTIFDASFESVENKEQFKYVCKHIIWLNTRDIAISKLSLPDAGLIQILNSDVYAIRACII